MRSVADKKNTEWIMKITGLLLFVFWPCLVHLDTVRTGLEKEPWFPDIAVQSDFFMHIRSSVLLFIGVLILLQLFYRIVVKRESILPGRIWFPLMIYGGFVVFSTVFSEYQSFCLKGMTEQYETVWVLLIYIAVCCYFYFAGGKEGIRNWMIRCVLAGAGVQGCIGLTQLAGHDFWNTVLGRTLILAGTSKQTSLEYIFEAESSGQVYLSFYHPNYAAVYLMLVLPLAMAAVVCFNKRWEKTAALILTGILFLCLWGTGSKAGFLTILLLTGIACLIFSEKAGRRSRFFPLFLVGGFLLLGIALLVPGENAVKEIIGNIFPEKTEHIMEDILLREDGIEVAYNGDRFILTMEEEEGKTYFSVKDETGGYLPLQYSSERARFYLLDEKYEELEFDAYTDDGTTFIVMYQEEIPWVFRKGKGADSYQYITLYNKVDVPENAVCAFAKGYENAFSGRMYLWSRTFPLLKKYVLIGSGPDTFAMVFPQNDYMARANVGLDMLMPIISKVHSLYLQIGIQTGLISLAALILFWMSYLVRSFRYLPVKREKRVWNRAMFLSVLSFLIMGLVNDSVVVVSPIFWALLGMGYGLTTEKNR